MYGRQQLATLSRNDTRYNDNQHNDNQHNDTHCNKLESFIVLCQKDLPGASIAYCVQGKKHLIY